MCTWLTDIPFKNKKDKPENIHILRSSADIGDISFTKRNGLIKGTPAGIKLEVSFFQISDIRQSSCLLAETGGVDGLRAGKGAWGSQWTSL